MKEKKSNIGKYLLILVPFVMGVTGFTVLVQKFLNKWTIFLFCSILFSSNQKEH